MSKPRIFMLVGLVAALVLVCLATFTLYARQQKPPAQPTDAVCKCLPQGTTEGVAIIHCACGNMNCLVARSVSTEPRPVSTSCKS